MEQKKTKKEIREDALFIAFLAGVCVCILIWTLRLDNSIDHWKSEGTYYKTGFGEKYTIYTFENTENVMYEFNGTFLFGEPAGGNEGGFYYDVSLDTDGWRNPELIGVTSKYLVFSVNEYTDSPSRINIAVEIAETDANFMDRYVHKEIPAEEMPILQKKFSQSSSPLTHYQ